MLKIRLLELDDRVLGDAEIDWKPDEMGSPAPDIVTLEGRSYVLVPGAAFDSTKIASAYRPAWSRRVLSFEPS